MASKTSARINDFQNTIEANENETRREQQLAYIERCRQGVHGSFYKALVDAFDKADNTNKMRLSLGFQEVFGDIV